LLAWYGDMELAPHLWSFAGLGSVKVVVEFHRTVTIDEFGSRKALAEYCRQAIGQGLADAISGRWQDGLAKGQESPAHQAKALAKTTGTPA
jgi:1-acyl-sn-glycerol-3-phosphate acyltransferase